MVRKTFEMMWKNARLLAPLWVLAVLAVMALIGLPEKFDEVSSILVGLVMMMVWLIAIFFVRNDKAGRKVSFFDGLFNATGPLLSTLTVLIVAVIQSLPLAILVVAYNAAVETHFLETFGYAVGFLIFALLMVGLTLYLLSSTTIALVAVSAPGLYPVTALITARDLVKGQRMKVILRLVVLIIMIVAMFGVIVVPLMNLATAEVASFGVVSVGVFATMLAATYLYVGYREMIDE